MQDQLIRDRITEEDVLIVSIGGNDIALQPLLCTIVNIALLVLGTPESMLERCACAVPVNCGCDCGFCLRRSSTRQH